MILALNVYTYLHFILEIGKAIGCFAMQDTRMSKVQSGKVISVFSNLFLSLAMTFSKQNHIIAI